MMLFPAPLRLLFTTLLCFTTALSAADVAALWKERLACTVAVEFFVETETDRRESTSCGTVIDDQGTIILPPSAINLRFSPDQLRGFKLYLPGEAVGSPCLYLGVDALTGWHFVRASEQIRPRLRPVTNFAAPQDRKAEPALAEDLWGIGLRGKDEDFIPYLLTSRLVLVNSLPQRTGITQQEIAAPGLPVFNRNGDFVGLAQSSFGQSFIQFSRQERGGASVMLVNVEESSAFLLADEVLPYLSRIPSSLFGRPLAWLGTYGLQPVDPEVARFLKLENQSAAVISEVLEGSPAEAAGIRERDIVLAINGQPLPRFKPDRVVTAYIDRAIDGAKPGEKLALSLLRDGTKIELEATLVDAPKLAREAERRYFERVGLTVREYVYSDAVLRRAKRSEGTGVIAHFVKPSGPASSAGLQIDDWIKTIDGVEVKTYGEALERLSAIEADTNRSDFVLLVSRNGDTSVLRVKLR